MLWYCYGMNRWLFALATAVVTAIVVGLGAQSTVSNEGIVVAGLAIVFLAWAAVWASTRSLASRRL